MFAGCEPSDIDPVVIDGSALRIVGKPVGVRGVLRPSDTKVVAFVRLLFP